MPFSRNLSPVGRRSVEERKVSESQNNLGNLEKIVENSKILKI